MSEQQRLILAVLISMGILLAWQWLVPSPEEPQPAQTTTQPATPAEPEPGAAEQPAAPEAEQPGAGEQPTQPGATGEQPAAAAPPVREIPVEQRTFATDFLRGEMSNVQASLTALEVENYDEPGEGDGDERPVSLATARREGATRQALISWQLGGRDLERMRWQQSDGSFVLAGEAANGMRARVRMTPREDAYALDYVLEVTNDSGKPQPVGAQVRLLLQPRGEKKSSFIGPPPDLMNGLCATPEDIERTQVDDLKEDGARKLGAVRWAAIDRQYFVVAAVPEELENTRCAMSAEGEVLEVDLGFDEETLAAGGTWQRRFTLFAGPKRGQALAAVEPSLNEVIDYSIWGIPLGFMARPMVFLLDVFHGWTTSWGLAIMMLTLLVKVLLFPFTYKSSLSMRKMALLRPEMEKIKKQFANDRERQQVEQMKLFKEKGVNPFGGCLPMLLQMPVWLALYRTLWSDVDLYQQAFLWIPNLTAKEPWPIMALLLGVLTYVQQKITPMATDSQQAKIMLYAMPIMLTVFMIALPSGLVLYILTNSILTIIQQIVINRRPVSL